MVTLNVAFEPSKNPLTRGGGLPGRGVRKRGLFGSAAVLPRGKRVGCSEQVLTKKSMENHCFPLVFSKNHGFPEVFTQYECPDGF